MSGTILCPFSPLKTEQSFLVFKAHLSTWTLIPFSPPAFSNIFLLTIPSFCGIFNLFLWTGSFPLVFDHVEIYPKSFKPWCFHSWILLYLSTLFHLQTPANSSSHCGYFLLLPSHWSLPLALSLQQASLTKITYDFQVTKSNFQASDSPTSQQLGPRWWVPPSWNMVLFGL